MILSSLSTKIPGGSLTHGHMRPPPVPPGEWVEIAMVPGGYREGFAVMPLTTGPNAGGAIYFGGSSGTGDAGEAGYDDDDPTYRTFWGPHEDDVGTWIYDPADDSWFAGAPMNLPRMNFAACLMADGRIMVSGGTEEAEPGGAHSTLEISVDIYDPVTDTWDLQGGMTYARAAHTLTLLPNGDILAAGGLVHLPSQRISEKFDLADDVWNTLKDMPEHAGVQSDMINHQAFLLPNDKVLLVGGHEPTGTPTYGRTMLYDIADESWAYGATMPFPASCVSCAQLPSGDVLVVGGVTGEFIPPGGADGDSATLKARIYRYATNTWDTVSDPRAAIVSDPEPQITLPLLITLDDGLILRALDSYGDAGEIGDGSRSFLYNADTDTWGPEFETDGVDFGFVGEGAGRLGAYFCKLTSGEVLAVDRYGEYGNKYIPPETP